MKNKMTWKIWLLVGFLLLSVVAIFGVPPKFLQDGVQVTSVEPNSTAFEQGLRKGQVVKYVDGKKIDGLDDFSNSLKDKFDFNESVKTTIGTDSGEFVLFSRNPPEITIAELGEANLELGLDLQGGSRAIVRAEDRKLTKAEAVDLARILENRLDVYGLEDIEVSTIADISGEQLIKIEIAGATPSDLRELVSQQGKFEAKIGNETAFVGGNKDITSVSRSGQESGIESCQQSGSGYYCRFVFVIYLSQDAAERHRDITDSLDLSVENAGYLSESLDLYLDDRLVESLFISDGLKGVLTTQISIQGSGTGTTRDEAYDNAVEEMKKLQTILITGSCHLNLKLLRWILFLLLLGRSLARLLFWLGWFRCWLLRL